MIDRHLILACPGDPGRRSGGTIYDQRVARGLRELGWRVDWLELPESFPWPSPADLRTSAEALRALPAGSAVLVDGLAMGAMSGIAAAQASRLRLMALVHHPLALEAGLTDSQQQELEANERQVLRHARSVLVTSETTRDTVAAMFGIPTNRIAVARPGTDPAPVAKGSGGAPEILAIGSVIPRKRLDLLVRSLAGSKDRPWHLTIAGATDRSAEATASLLAAIMEEGIADRVTIAGELDEAALAEAFDRSDLFVSSSAYEGFGMAIAEAVARGLPVVAVDGGAIGEWLDRDAAMLVPVDDPHELATALAEVLDGGERLAALRRGAVTARSTLPTWTDTARLVEQYLQWELAT